MSLSRGNTRLPKIFSLIYADGVVQRVRICASVVYVVHPSQTQVVASQDYPPANFIKGYNCLPLS